MAPMIRQTFSIWVWAFSVDAGAPFPDAGQFFALAIASFASIMAASLSLNLMLGSPTMGMFLTSIIWGLLETLIALAGPLRS